MPFTLNRTQFDSLTAQLKAGVLLEETDTLSGAISDGEQPDAEPFDTNAIPSESDPVDQLLAELRATGVLIPPPISPPRSSLQRSNPTATDNSRLEGSASDCFTWEAAGRSHGS